MDSMVFQLRVVAGMPRCFSRTALEYVWPSRRTLNANLPVMATTWTSHFAPAGCSIGSGSFARGAFCSTLTNRPWSFPKTASPNQFPARDVQNFVAQLRLAHILAHDKRSSRADVDDAELHQ